jgi:hypothetical protein
MAGKYKAVALAFAAVLIGGATAMAQQVGTATAVNPNSESTPPGGSTIRLTVGARVVHKERIHTSPTGSVQLLFVDQSTLNIAPNTNLLIDEFVYDPASGNGHMLTKLTQGTLQYIGGKLSWALSRSPHRRQRSASAAAPRPSITAPKGHKWSINTAPSPLRTAAARLW